MSERIDLFGGPEAYNHYAVGWAHAMDTPYQWTKQVASHFGGTRNGTIVRWPAGIDARGEVRSQFHHVIDIVPTILDVAGLPAPVFVDGVQQKPLEGVSMTYSFNDPDAAERHETQYFEMFGNRGIYHKGWTAVTKHRTPWETGPDVVTPAFDDDVWELYDTTTDWTQAHDVSSQHPDKLHELQRLWLIEAVKYDVVPLDDRFATRALPEMSGRPALVTGRKQLLFGGMGRLTESSVLSMKNTSFSMTAEIVVPETGAEGVIVAQGGVTGGMSLYLKDGRPKFCYNFFGLERYYAEGSQKVTPGTHQVRMEFTYDGGGIGKGGISRLFIDGVDIGSGRIEQTEAFLFSADETCDVGDEFGSPVTTDYNVTTFTGEVNWVELELGLDDNNHLIDPSDRIRLAMGIQ
jgi:arylsulfatase